MDDEAEAQAGLDARLLALATQFPGLTADADGDAILDAVLLQFTNDPDAHYLLDPNDLLGRVGAWLFPVYAQVCGTPDRLLLAELANLWDGDKDSAVKQVHLLKSRLVRTRDPIPRARNSEFLYTAAGFWQLAAVLDEWVDGRVGEVVEFILERLTSDD